MNTVIHPNDGSPEPEEDSYFIIAQNGLFLRNKFDWVDAVVPVKGIRNLEKQEARATLLLPRIKSTVIAKAVQFFKAVYDKQKTEAAVLLHYSPQEGWELTVPEQTATGGHVAYKPTKRLPGYRCVGTMHSHCAMSAYHSSTDVRDEAQHDGVHITIGRLDKYPHFGMDAEVVVQGTRFPLPLEHFIYVTEVEEKKRKRPTGFWFGKRDPLYRIPFGILRSWTVPEEWLAQVVEKRVFTRAPATPVSDEPPLQGDSSGQAPWGLLDWVVPYPFSKPDGERS